MNYGGIFEVKGEKGRIKELEEKLSQVKSWKGESQIKVLRELNYLQEKEGKLKGLSHLYEDVSSLIELLREEEDEGLAGELREKFALLEKDVDGLILESLLEGKSDKANAILSIHSGAGGTDACDWAEILLRMYLRWIEKKGYKARIVEYVLGEEAGIKTATVIVEGKFSYGYLKEEIGIHRLVRISPFDASHRRHTSFAAVNVIPEAENEDEMEIKEKDLKIDTYRAGGPGGQHVNVTDSAIRITHLPSGIVVQCQDQRSQYQNKATAMKILKARLYNLRNLEKEKELEKKRKGKAKIEWGSQRRSYILHPYTMVKDHYTGVEKSNVESVFEGEIDDFINASLKKSH